jgi:hypothetical protein
VVPVGELPPEGVVLCGVVAPPLDGVVAPLEGEVDPPLWVVPVPLVEVVVALLADGVVPTEGADVGTLNCGTPAVSVVPVPPPPQAASPSPNAIATTVAAAALNLPGAGSLRTSASMPR